MNSALRLQVIPMRQPGRMGGKTRSITFWKQSARPALLASDAQELGCYCACMLLAPPIRKALLHALCPCQSAAR